MPVMERNVMKLRKCVGLNSIVLLSCFIILPVTTTYYRYQKLVSNLGAPNVNGYFILNMGT